MLLLLAAHAVSPAPSTWSARSSRCPAASAARRPPSRPLRPARASPAPGPSSLRFQRARARSGHALAWRGSCSGSTRATTLERSSAQAARRRHGPQADADRLPRHQGRRRRSAASSSACMFGAAAAGPTRAPARVRVRRRRLLRARAVSLDARQAPREDEVRPHLPDALDLLAVSVEAGLGFDGAVAKLTEHMEGPLVDEFALTLGEMRIGESRQDALKKLAERAPTPEVASVRPRDRPGRPARHLARPDPAGSGRRHAAEAAGGRRGEGDEGADQDALPDGPLHLPGDVHRHPRAGVLNLEKLF